MASARILSRLKFSYLLSPRATYGDAVTKAVRCAQIALLVSTRPYTDAMGRPRVYFDMAAGDAKLGRIEFEVLCLFFFFLKPRRGGSTGVGWVARCIRI